MKIEKPRHNHKLTDLLKVCIFSLLMLAPLVASCSQWIYATINKNAYQSYSGTQTQYQPTPKYEHGDINEGLEVNKIYHFDYQNLYTEGGIGFSDYLVGSISFELLNGLINIDNMDSTFLDEPFFSTDLMTNNIQIIYNYTFGTTFSLSLYLDDNWDNGYVLEVDLTNDILKLQGDILINEFNISWETTVADTYKWTDVFSNTTYQVYDYVQVESTTLDNAFYYGVDQMTKSELFNWTQNTALYSGIKAMTDNLQIETNAIAILLTYWFILTIIYIIVDIVLKLFTTITHLGTKE